MTFTVAAHPGDPVLFPLRKRLCSLGGAREHSLEQGQAAQCANVLSRGRLTAGWGVSGGGAGGNRKPMSGSYEHWTRKLQPPESSRAGRICKRLWLMYNQSAKASHSYPVSCAGLYGTLARHVPDLLPSQ